ncbi:peptidoglycan bridge formation glycyltransferase FemA/FemB family protein [Candidatus Saccharibacteria bacterium]|nr:peptidoglycan bridge formation glycyltransferase FemA/FemB family protein [Candidatus Saccharibacteria bacterium]
MFTREERVIKTSPDPKIADWDKIVKKYPEANFLQSPEYGRMNEILGSKVIYDNFDGKGFATMVVRNAKRGRYLEIPCGPLIDWEDKSVAREVLDKISEIAAKEKCVFVRIRPQLTATAENLQILSGLGFKKSPMHLAAEHTVILDLTRSDEEMLASMRRQTRYEVRRGVKMGLTVSRDNSEEIFREFHAVQAETARRQNFVPPSLKTLLAEREAFSDKIWIYKVINENEPVAYGLIVGSGLEADYYEAASTLLNRKLPGAYMLLWQAMRDLKKDDYERFNLWGIAPAGQPHHRYAGVTTFKTGFGGEVVEFVPAHDLVISKIKYMKNLAVETMRKKKRHL